MTSSKKAMLLAHKIRRMTSLSMSFCLKFAWKQINVESEFVKIQFIKKDTSAITERYAPVESLQGWKCKDHSIAVRYIDIDRTTETGNTSFRTFKAEYLVSIEPVSDPILLDSFIMLRTYGVAA